MKRSIVPFSTGVAALSAAVLITGCCGPKRDRTSAYYSPGTTSAQYSATPDTSAEARAQVDTTTPAVTAGVGTDADRTQVRETVGAGQNIELPLYAESLRVGKREVENGSVTLRKVVRTESASQPVELRRETVVIDREAFDQARRAADAGQPNQFGMAFQEKEITIDLKREEPVVEVQPYISGRIVAQKRQTTDQQTVDRQIRREEIEVVKQGNDRDIMVSERVRTTGEAVGAPGTDANRQTGNGQDTKARNESEPPRQQR